jgi:hypothetical protein
LSDGLLLGAHLVVTALYCGILCSMMSTLGGLSGLVLIKLRTFLQQNTSGHGLLCATVDPDQQVGFEFSKTMSCLNNADAQNSARTVLYAVLYAR